jgi:acetate kinase
MDINGGSWIMIAKAILKINSSAKFIVEDDDINKITWKDGTTPISKTDIEAKMAELPTEEEEKIARENKRISGKQKLKDLGLDDDEIKALIGT